VSKADELRSAMVDRLVAAGCITSSSVGDAMRSVPRHSFVPGIDPRLAHADEAIAIKRHHGVVVSSVSQPTMVAIMLEMLDVHSGSRILEIGTGSGYNAALLSELTGDDGSVVTIEVDKVLAGLASVQLSRSGYRSVDVHCADGKQGWPSKAPYDRIIVTASSPRPEPSWEAQLVEDGRLVVPLRDELEAVCFEKTSSGLERVGASPAVFIPLR
jgi:protein-L-isoaspartate(D-aspartate) O-methyltransferase